MQQEVGSQAPGQEVHEARHAPPPAAPAPCPARQAALAARTPHQVSTSGRSEPSPCAPAPSNRTSVRQSSTVSEYLERARHQTEREMCASTMAGSKPGCAPSSARPPARPPEFLAMRPGQAPAKPRRAAHTPRLSTHDAPSLVAGGSPETLERLALLLAHVAQLQLAADQELASRRSRAHASGDQHLAQTNCGQSWVDECGVEREGEGEGEGRGVGGKRTRPPSPPRAACGRPADTPGFQSAVYPSFSALQLLITLFEFMHSQCSGEPS